MAAEWDESSLDLSEFDTSSVTRLQALCRGWLTRKEIQHAQVQFLEIIADIDGPSVEVDWTNSTLPQPIICKASKQSRLSKWKAAVPSSDQGPVKNSGINACTSTQDCESQALKAETVSTQTSQDLEAARLQEKNVGDRPIRDSPPSSGVSAHSPEDMIRGDVAVNYKMQASQNNDIVNDGVEDGEKFLADHGKNRIHSSSFSSVDGKSEKSHLSNDKKAERFHLTSVGDKAGKDCEPRCGTTNTTQPTRPEDHYSDCNNSNIEVPALTDSDNAPTTTFQPFSSDPTLSSTWTPSQRERVRAMDTFHGDQTSVWDSSSSVAKDCETAHKKTYGQQRDMQNQGKTSDKKEDTHTMTAELTALSTEDLMYQKQSVAMELLWVQQAIISRKQYLKLKTQMDTAS